MINKPHKIYANYVEATALEQFRSALDQPFVVQGALMPDAHTGYTLPIGAVIATKGVVVPAYVGYDIGCGLCSVPTDFDKEDIINNRLEIFQRIMEDLPLSTNKHSLCISQNEKLKYEISAVCARVGESALDAVLKLGTLGSGNHFAEIGCSENGKVWITVHSGSRHFGHSIASYYMAQAARENSNLDNTKWVKDFESRHADFKCNNPAKYHLALEAYCRTMASKAAPGSMEGHNGLDVNSQMGKLYIKDMAIALAYALENRRLIVEIIVNTIAGVLDKECVVNYSQMINRNHNHAELNIGDCWIHRKGATHAEKGMLGVIPGNMKDGVFIVRGKGNPDSLCSSSHGAGRIMSRSKAKQTIKLEKFTEMMADVTANVSSSTVDESPAAYKDIFEVMALQADLVDIVDYVRPIINIKG
jgi:tRNA-splicing ligase RtcB